MLKESFEPKTDCVVQAVEVSRIYSLGEHTHQALNKVSLQVSSQAFCAIAGPSGSGKSTLLNILGCLERPSSGDVFVEGISTKQLTVNQLADFRSQKLGFVFQTFNLLNRLNAIDNVALPLVYAGVPQNERNERAKIVLEKVGLKDRMNHKPNELSGGQRQRVAVARALINNPSLLLADEPTGNLDTKTSYEIMSLFDEIHQSRNTIVLVTHEEDIAKHAKHIVRMRDGEIEKI